jgi:hypothetical protein
MEKQSCTECLKAPEIAYSLLVTLAPMALEIFHRDLTNRVCLGHVWPSSGGSCMRSVCAMMLHDKPSTSVDTIRGYTPPQRR